MQFIKVNMVPDQAYGFHSLAVDCSCSHDCANLLCTGSKSRIVPWVQCPLFLQPVEFLLVQFQHNIRREHHPGHIHGKDLGSSVSLTFHIHNTLCFLCRFYVFFLYAQFMVTFQLGCGSMAVVCISGHIIIQWQPHGFPGQTGLSATHGNYR